MELPNRSTLESEAAKNLAGMTTRHRQQLRRLMGSPPDPSRVPSSFWADVARDAEERIAAIVYMLFLAAGNFHGGSKTRLQSPARSYGERRGNEAGLRYAGGARNKFEGLAEALDRFRKAGKELSRAELEVELTRVFGSTAAEQIAKRETTMAQTAGGDAGVDDAGQDGAEGEDGRPMGTSPDDIWSNRPHHSKTGPCENCKALDGVPRSEWAFVQLPDADGDQYGAAGGPPLHDGCVCEVQHAALPTPA